jgi:hypothetical protein
MRNRLDKFCYSQDWKAGAPKVSIPEVSCCQQAIPLIEAVWSQYSKFRAVSRQPFPDMV